MLCLCRQTVPGQSCLVEFLLAAPRVKVLMERGERGIAILPPPPPPSNPFYPIYSFSSFSLTLQTCSFSLSWCLTRQFLTHQFWERTMLLCFCPSNTDISSSFSSPSNFISIIFLPPDQVEEFYPILGRAELSNREVPPRRNAYYGLWHPPSSELYNPSMSNFVKSSHEFWPKRFSLTDQKHLQSELKDPLFL